MLAAGVLLISLSILSVHGENFTDDYYIDYGDYNDTDQPSSTVNLGDWLFDFFHPTNVCDPNPCYNDAPCQSTSDTEFTCLCPEPYIGKRCQRVRKVCENVKCGRGDCIFVDKAPYYECKCQPPYQGADCKTLPASPCEPNPCQNGANCVKGNRRLRCACPDGFTGRFCEIAASDCYEGNGETYRGVVSMTEGGKQCLDWRSYFILENVDNPFTVYSHFNGLEENHCRNPDDDSRPWCYYKDKGKLEWDYCRVKKCSDAPTTPPPVAPTVPDSPQFSQCGKSQSVPFGRIFRGSKAIPGAHPWQVSLQKRLKGSNLAFQPMCGGILLSSCHVLTAAHCIREDPEDSENPEDSEFQVMLGGGNLFKKEAMDQTIPVIDITVHENYSKPLAWSNDVAMLKLQVTDSPYCAKETRFVKTVCLPDGTFPAGTSCKISGYGRTENSENSSNLLSANVFLIPKERCKTLDDFGKSLDDSMICAGYMQGSINSCSGDSGGPLVCAKNGTHYVVGVVSWGMDCAEKNKPGVYANVNELNSWIKSKMN